MILQQPATHSEIDLLVFLMTPISLLAACRLRHESSANSLTRPNESMRDASIKKNIIIIHQTNFNRWLDLDHEVDVFILFVIIYNIILLLY